MAKPPRRGNRQWSRAAVAPLMAVAGVALYAHGLGPVSAKSVAASPVFSKPSAPAQPNVPLAADDGASAEMFVKLQPDDRLDRLLIRAGVAATEAATAQQLIAGALRAGLAPGTEVAVLLGDATLAGRPVLKRVTLRTGLELKLSVVRDGGGGLRLLRQDISVDSSPLRFSGRTGSSLYWSLRARGVPAEVASEYLSLVSNRVDLGDIRPDDGFDLVLAHRRAATGEEESGPLLYAAIDRRSGRDVQLVNWTASGRSGWFDANSGTAQSTAWAWPVPGRVSSSFGTRVHPILRFARFHRGVDLSAPWGTPIVAAADGRVVGAGWNGGHGRQVRIVHQGGVETSYSHMSQITSQAGASVRRGQLIGYVGSTGFSTGPHLHYEVHERGRPVDPLRARHSGTASLSQADRASIRARVRQLLATDA